jgi:hypothetical protein
MNNKAGVQIERTVFSAAELTGRLFYGNTVREEAGSRDNFRVR